MQLPVAPVVVKPGVFRKVMLAGMLHHQPSVGQQQVVLEHIVDDFIDVGQVVGRVSEDDVELLAACGGVGEGILPDDGHLVVVLQLVNGLLYKLGTQQVLIDGHHRQRPA